MSEQELGDLIGRLSADINRLTGVISEGRQKASLADGGREAAAKDGQAEIAAQLTAIDQKKQADAEAARKAEIAEAVKAALADVRLPSMAAQIGQRASQVTGLQMVEPHGSLKASLGGEYQAGKFLTAVLDINSIATQGIDIEAITRGKAALAEIGLAWANVPDVSKATLGATGATGGYVLPNNLVANLIKPKTQAAIYTAGPNPLLTVIPGVAVRGVDQPYRTGAPTRMTFQDWGTTKENVNETYGSYTATLGTAARVMDIGKQYARFSAGAAERDVIDELTRAAQLAENYYVIAGAGTGSVGTGDPTVGIYTALNNVFSAYTTAFSASNSTVAGSGASALATAMGALAGRNQEPSAAVVDATTFWTIARQGSDNAGFWMSDFLGAGFVLGSDNQLSWRGMPIYYDANLGTNATTKIAIVGDWKQLKFYRGMEFRIDVSDVAGDRFDKNLIGFRGEEEFGVNAYPAVFVGAFQLITGVIP